MGKRRKYLIGVVFVLPSVLILFLMMFYPTVQTFWFSVSKVKLPTFETSFNGLNNFSRVIAKPEFWMVIKNTLIWVVGSVVIRFVIGFWAALTMNSDLKGMKVFQLIALFPWVIPSIVAGNTWKWMFQSDYGLLNSVLTRIGLAQFTHPWLGDSHTALWAILVASVWTGYPFIMLMILAGLKGIPDELYEAAKVDGASSVQLFRFITLPGLKSVITIILLLQIIWAWNTFDLIFVMTGGGPGGATEILGLFIYRLGFNSFDFSGAAAMGVLLLSFTIGFLILYLIVSSRRREVTS